MKTKVTFVEFDETAPASGVDPEPPRRESQEYFAEGQQADLLVEYLDDFYEAIKSDLHSANILEIDPSTGRPVPAGP